MKGFDAIMISMRLNWKATTKPSSTRGGKASVLVGMVTAVCVAFSANIAALTTQQQTFLSAEKAQSSGDYSRYQTLVGKLQNYPLLPYLKYRELPPNLTLSQKDRVEKLIRQYPDSPPGQLLYKDWMSFLFENKQWQALLDFYDPSIAETDDTLCQSTTAQLHAGARQEAFAKTKELWLTPDAQPESCDSLFSAWRSAGLLTEKLAWARFELALRAKQTTFASYLKRFLSASQQTQADKWLKISNDPSLTRSTKQIGIDNSGNRDLAVYGVGLIARKNLDLAMSVWRSHKNTYRFSEKQVYRASQDIGLQMALKKRPEAYQWLSHIPVASLDLSNHEWLIRSAMMAGKWKEVHRFIAQLPANSQQELRWQYWTARSLDLMGDKPGSEKIYKQLAKNRHYYGFLAADRVHVSYAFQNKPLDLSPSRLEKVTQAHQGILRAREFYQLGRELEAKREWYRTTTRMTPSEMPVAAFYASQWGWHDRAIVAMGKSDNKNDLALRFPLLYQGEVRKAAKKYGLNPALIYAIIRQESAFMVDAKSPVGAMGLMQLMPATANELARKANSPLKTASELMKPRRNIDLGSMYLQRALRRYDLHPALTAASYNAGSGNVARWLPNGPVEADLWVETVPFKETRNYVMNVVAYINLYEHRLGQPSVRITERMPTIGGRLDLVSANISPSRD